METKTQIPQKRIVAWRLVVRYNQRLHRMNLKHRKGGDSECVETTMRNPNLKKKKKAKKKAARKKAKKKRKKKATTTIR